MSGLASWTAAKAEDAGGVLVRYAQALDARLDARLQTWELLSAVYSEQLEVSLRPSRNKSLGVSSAARNANCTFNVARSLVETEHATVTEADPRPTFVTDDADRPQQDKAVELQRAVDGLMSDLRGYETLARTELDKCVLGTGVVKVHRIGNRPQIDRVLISEILVDEDLIGPGQEPKQIIHRTEVSREAMLVWFDGMHKDKARNARCRQAIIDAPASVSSTLQSQRADLITVYDAYSAPLDEEHPGLHAIAIENFEEFLFDEPWKSPRLPFVFQRWQRPTNGFYGIGVVEQVLGIQVEINRFYRNVSRALKRWGIPIALIPTDAKINTAAWTNTPDGLFIPYVGSGGTPSFMNGNLLTPEVMQWLQFQIENAYKVTGIPQNTAFAQREEGIPSARGQREISQKAASRLAPQSKQYERTFVDVAWLLDDIIRAIRADNGELVISSVDQGALHKVDIDSAISLEPGTYKIDIFAGNLLSRHPASKREEVQELTKAGIFTALEGKAMIVNPEVAATIGKAPDTAGIYKRYIENAIKRGKYKAPEDFWPDLELGKKLFGDALFEHQASGTPDDRLQILRDWLVAARDIMQPPGQPTPEAAAQPAQQQEAA